MLAYADMVLLAPSLYALQSLIKILERWCTQLDIVCFFNCFFNLEFFCKAASNVGPYGLFWQPALVRYSLILYVFVY